MCVCVYIYYLLHRKQLHVSALGNRHLEFVYETLIKQLYKTCILATYMAQGGGKVSNTTIWCVCIYIIYYIENNYMFRRLVIAIFRLYMKHLLSSYTKHVYWLLIWRREGVKCARDLVSVLKVGRCGLHGKSNAVTKLCLSLL